MKRVRYNNIPLAEDLETALPERSDIFGSAENTQTEGSKPSSGRRSRNRKAEQTPKVDTRRLTLALFSAGLSMEEIAAQRNLAVSTIESHLAEFAGKEVSIDKFFGPDELDEIGTALKPFLDHDNPPFKIIYGQTGGKYTYGKLRMALGYLKRSSNKEEPDTESA
ncbi:MAG: helix-turn-helix domain-containing protein [Tannerella sp.]|nr:helix-turn-helix domain-containing protein [Tannerella sp.]